MMLRVINYHVKKGRVNVDLDINNWTVSQHMLSLPKQRDNTSCGLYVIYYASEVLKEMDCNIPTANISNINKYRQFICTEILQRSENFDKICKLCSLTNTDSEIVTCWRCEKICHVHCLPLHEITRVISPKVAPLP